MLETWKPIPGYEGWYEAGDQGSIRSVARVVTYSNGKRFSYRSRVLHPAVTSDGYLRVSLTKNNQARSYLVHRLVALAFLCNPENHPEVNHLNGDRADNAVSNLAWVSSSDNVKHSFDVLGRKPSLLGKAGAEHHLSRAVTVRGVTYGSHREAARILGCSRHTIKKIEGSPT